MEMRPARVLIVDDSVESTELLALLLERRGHQVQIAHDVEEALRVAQEFKPGVALLDIMIRCESGYFLAEELRSLPGLAGCRVIAMTGFDRDQHRQASKAAGFYSHLTKPIDIAALFAAVEAPQA
jgi:CheY-like chemotaxis protein